MSVSEIRRLDLRVEGLRVELRKKEAVALRFSRKLAEVKVAQLEAWKLHGLERRKLVTSARSELRLAVKSQLLKNGEKRIERLASQTTSLKQEHSRLLIQCGKALGAVRNQQQKIDLVVGRKGTLEVKEKAREWARETEISEELFSLSRSRLAGCGGSGPDLGGPVFHGPLSKPVPVAAEILQQPSVIPESCPGDTVRTNLCRIKVEAQTGEVLSLEFEQIAERLLVRLNSPDPQLCQRLANQRTDIKASLEASQAGVSELFVLGGMRSRRDREREGRQ